MSEEELTPRYLPDHLRGRTRQVKRVGVLDELRGLCVLLMLVYHGLYDAVYIFGWDFPAYRGPFFTGMQIFIAWNFIFVSGISCRYSRSNVRRGLITLGLGITVSLVTWFFMPGQMIWFGILHFLGTAMLLFGLFGRALEKLPTLLGMAICALLFVFTFNLPSGTVGLPYLFEFALPDWLYAYPWLLPLGIGGSGSDYFPLFPWIFLFLPGTFLGREFIANRMPGWLYRNHIHFFAGVGKHTLLIYMVHQPVLYGVLWVVFWVVNRVYAL
jgi:uncharacterized membrane protein